RSTVFIIKFFIFLPDPMDAFWEEPFQMTDAYAKRAFLTRKKKHHFCKIDPTKKRWAHSPISRRLIVNVPIPSLRATVRTLRNTRTRPRRIGHFGCNDIMLF